MAWIHTWNGSTSLIVGYPFFLGCFVAPKNGAGFQFNVCIYDQGR